MSSPNTISDKVRVVRWRMTNEKTKFSDELKVIPKWAYALSLTLLVGLELFIPFMRRHEEHPAPIPVMMFFVLFGGLMISLFGLLIGYVNRDAKRRGMNVTLWTLIVIFIPNAIGFIIYFLVREPLVFDCPQCGGKVSARFNFCPKCKYNLYPACPECKHSARPGDHFCPYCAHDLSGDVPAGSTPFTGATPEAKV